MAKFSGKIGYALSVESGERPGIWTDTIVEKPHFGDVIRDFRRYAQDEYLLNTLNISNKISVTANSYILDNAHRMKYALYKNVRWDIISFDIAYPKIILTLGGVYNGPIPDPA